MSSCLAFLRAFCQSKIEHQARLFFLFPFNHRRRRGGKGAMSPQIASISFHSVLWKAVSGTKHCLSLKFKVFGLPKKFRLATLLLVTAFIKTACIFLAPSHVPQYHAFHTTCTSNLMYNLPHIHWLKARNNARSPDNVELRWKAVLSSLYCVAKNIVLLLHG